MGGRLRALRRSHSKSFPSGASEPDNGSEEAWGEDGNDIRTSLPIHMRKEDLMRCQSLTCSPVHCKLCRPHRPTH